jgi:hypothetical protein
MIYNIIVLGDSWRIDALKTIFALFLFVAALRGEAVEGKRSASESEVQSSNSGRGIFRISVNNFNITGLWEWAIDP